MNENCGVPVSSDTAPILLELRDVVKSYGANRVLDGVSFNIARGGIIGLLGPNGCGKSTLIKLVCSLLTTDSGSIRINGMAPSPETASVISYLPDTNTLPQRKTVEAVFNYYADFFSDFDKVKAYEMLSRLGIDRGLRIRTLSKGTKEKVQLILAMSRRAQLYILDEPLGGVDPAARDYILETILKSYNKDASILITTHLVYDIQDVLDDVIFLNHGKAVLCASVSAIREQHGKTVDELFREVYRC